MRIDVKVHTDKAMGESALLDLCREEVRKFEKYLRGQPGFEDGLAKFERSAIEGYLYQKLRGRIDADTSGTDVVSGVANGTP